MRITRIRSSVDICKNNSAIAQRKSPVQLQKMKVQLQSSMKEFASKICFAFVYTEFEFINYLDDLNLTSENATDYE